MAVTGGHTWLPASRDSSEPTTEQAISRWPYFTGGDAGNRAHLVLLGYCIFSIMPQVLCRYVPYLRLPFLAKDTFVMAPGTDWQPSSFIFMVDAWTSLLRARRPPALALFVAGCPTSVADHVVAGQGLLSCCAGTWRAVSRPRCNRTPADREFSRACLLFMACYPHACGAASVGGGGLGAIGGSGGRYHAPVVIFLAECAGVHHGCSHRR